jgi:hypothetical protein
MAVIAKVLAEGVLAPAANAALYQAPNATRTIIDKLTACNTSAAVATLSVHLLPPAGAAGPANIVVQAKALQPGETYTCPEVVGHVLAPGGIINITAGTAAVITVRASGREVT